MYFLNGFTAAGNAFQLWPWSFKNPFTSKSDKFQPRQKYYFTECEERRHNLLRWKMIDTTNPHYINYRGAPIGIRSHHPNQSFPSPHPDQFSPQSRILYCFFRRPSATVNVFPYRTTKLIWFVTFSAIGASPDHISERTMCSEA